MAVTGERESLQPQVRRADSRLFASVREVRGTCRGSVRLAFGIDGGGSATERAGYGGDEDQLSKWES